MSETIFALSSGTVPAGIGVIRISGPSAKIALETLAGKLPPPRRASLAKLCDSSHQILDRALVLWLPGPNTATGEDMVELHCHGGRAVIAAIETALMIIPKLRRATSGEFTRRAFANGKIDLSEAEGLADLLSAETELQRRSAMAMAGGEFSQTVVNWRQLLLQLSASIEAILDFADEDDVATLPANFFEQVDHLRQELLTWLSRPKAELLREGYRVVIAGPPNVGKSTLFNVLVGSEAAIATPIAGTTRDVLTRPVALEGVPFLFADTAGLHDDVEDVVEAIGIERALEALDNADLVLWLGPEGKGPSGCWEIASQCDRQDVVPKSAARHHISAITGTGINLLSQALVSHARNAMPKPGEAALNARQHELLSNTVSALTNAIAEIDPLLCAENLRLARICFDSLLGKANTEDMLDTLFGRFCIGK